MPRSSELPERISDFTRRHAPILPDIGFQQTLGRLIQSIEGAEQERLAQEAESAQKAEQEEERRQAAKRARLEEKWN